MKAFHSDPALKQTYVDRVRGHMAADQLVQGYGYWKDGKGCAVGCSIHSGNHADYETLLGIPEVLARLEDSIFEALPIKEARQWPLRFFEAITPGAYLSMVWPKFAHWLLVDSEHGVIRFAKTERTKTAIESVAALYARWIAGDKPGRREWESAASDAASASASASDAACSASSAAAYAAAAYADVDAAYAANASAAYAAAAYAAAAYADADAAYADAEKTARKAQAEKLLQLITEAT